MSVSPRTLISELASPFVGREEEARVLVLALLSGEHVVFLGEPGTAKSALIERLAILTNGKFFKRVLNAYSTKDTLIGEIDIKYYREKGVMARKLEDSIITSDYAFIDEIFKANSDVLNVLLPILQEREIPLKEIGDEEVAKKYGLQVVQKGTLKVVKLPLKMVAGASNEIPEEEELQALYDRLTLRKVVQPVQETNLDDLIVKGVEFTVNKNNGVRVIVTEDVINKWRDDVKAIALTVRNNKKFREKFAELLAEFRREGIHLTDRRIVKTVIVASANAFINGRKSLSPVDLEVLKYIAPIDFEDFPKVQAIIADKLKLSFRIIEDFKQMLQELETIYMEVSNLPEFDPKLPDYQRRVIRIIDRAKEKLNDVQEVDEEVKKLYDEIVDRADKIKKLIARKIKLE